VSGGDSHRLIDLPVISIAFRLEGIPLMESTRTKKLVPLFIVALLVAVVLLLATNRPAPAQVARTPETKETAARRTVAPLAPSALIVQDMDSGITAEDMAQALVGSGVTISGVSYTGATAASGVFSGGSGIIGFDDGILLTSGLATNVVGPNVSDSISENNLQPGDAELSELSGFDTFDAAVLEFDFVPTESTVFFRFVFASDEYNEWVNTEYNDVFAFFVNGTNCALVESDPVTINTINFGNPYGDMPYSHPEFYVNNDLDDGGPFLDTEMDGRTKVLTCAAEVDQGGENHMKLAIADSSDGIYDSAVFLEAESLTSASTVELTGLEVTQAIQDLTNDVELVSDKTTYVRAHLRSASGTTIFNVKGKLIGRRDGMILSGSPLTPQNPGANIDALALPNRAMLNQSLYFRLPPWWDNGTVELEFVGLTHEVDCLEVASTPNDCKATVSFLDTPEAKVSIIGIQWEDSGSTLHDPNLADYEAIVQDMLAEHPIPDLDWDRPYELNDWVDNGGPPDDDGTLSDWSLSDVNAELASRRSSDGVTDRLYYGLLVDYVSGADLGLAPRPGWVGSGFYRATDPTTFAHEVGHNYGRRHVNCNGRERDVDTSYPYTGGRISTATTGNNAYYGFHIATQQVFSPGTGALLGYCRPRWVSDYTYEAMRSVIVSRWGPSPAPRVAGPLAAGDPAVLVTGIVDIAGDSGDIVRLFQLPSPGDLAPPDSGDFTIRLEDNNSAVLASYDFTPGEPSEGTDAVFSFLLPWEANTEKIVLLYQGSELDTLSASANPPQVGITSPISGTAWNNLTETVTWSASDNDGDDLTFAVQYSADDGNTWQTLTTGATGNSYTVSRYTLPGSASARVRVLASDGFHTAADTSGAFTSALNSPEVLITGPVSGSFAVEDQLVFMSGSGQDPEDGQLTDNQLTWSSDLDGELGSGKLLVTNALSMTEGVHTLTLVAQDSDGMMAEDSILFEVFRERPELPPSLAIDTNGLTIVASEGSAPFVAHTFSVANEGDGSIQWKAESDVQWISLSSETGFTPDTLIMTLDISGLSPGEYEGTITFIGDGALNSPQIVDVLLIVDEGNKVYLPIVLVE
jgi:hypothetical protein